MILPFLLVFWLIACGFSTSEVGVFMPTEYAHLESLCRYVPQGSRFLDLGSGDGRVVKHAIKECGADAWGIEYDDYLYEHPFVEVKDRITHGNFFDYNWSSYDVIYYYLAGSNEEVRLLRKLREECKGIVIFYDNEVSLGYTGLFYSVIGLKLIEQYEYGRVYSCT